MRPRTAIDLALAAATRSLAASYWLATSHAATWRDLLIKRVRAGTARYSVIARAQYRAELAQARELRTRLALAARLP